jgi:hypothetical protein
MKGFVFIVIIIINNDVALSDDLQKLTNITQAYSQVRWISSEYRYAHTPPHTSYAVVFTKIFENDEGNWLLAALAAACHDLRAIAIRVRRRRHRHASMLTIVRFHSPICRPKTSYSSRPRPSSIARKANPAASWRTPHVCSTNVFNAPPPIVRRSRYICVSYYWCRFMIIVVVVVVVVDRPSRYRKSLAR